MLLSVILWLDVIMETSHHDPEIVVVFALKPESEPDLLLQQEILIY